MATVKRCLLAALFIVFSLPASANVQEEIVKQIHARTEYTRQHLETMPGIISSEGALEFWSSGGLLQRVRSDTATVEYDYYLVTPKHIEVIELATNIGVALYYVEGSLKAKGGKAVPKFLVRALEVYVRENGNWKVRSSHWSPIQGGAGVTETSTD